MTIDMHTVADPRSEVDAAQCIFPEDRVYFFDEVGRMYEGVVIGKFSPEFGSRLYIELRGDHGKGMRLLISPDEIRVWRA